MRAPCTLLRLLLLLSLASLLPASAAAGTGGRVAYTGATIFDGTGADPIVDGVLLVDGDRVSRVGSREAVRIPRGAERVELDGRWIVPGLVDAHVHFFQSAGLYTRPDVIDLRDLRSYAWDQEGIRAALPETFARYLASGVTAVVDVGGPFWNFEVREAARSSELAPRVAVAGPLISTVERPQLDLGDPPIIQAQSPEHARELVREQLEQAPDLVKVWFILDPERGAEAALPMVRAVIDEAHAGGVRVAVHAMELETARAAVQAGADVLVHSVADQPVDDAFLALLVDRDVVFTSTLMVLEGYAEVLGRAPGLSELERELGDPAVIATWDELLAADLSPETAERNEARMQRLAHSAPLMASNLVAVQRAGVAVSAGTDAGNIGTVHGPAMHRELQLMVGAGLSPREALLAATRDAARVFSDDPEIGSLIPGKLADFLILEADPLLDVANLQRIESVVLGGHLARPDELLPPTPATLVQRQVEAYNARDLEAFLAFYAEDVEVLRHPTGELVASGREAMREIYGPMFEASPELHCHILQRITAGDFVVDHEHVTGMRGGEPLRAVAIYELRGGLIARVWFLPRAT